MKVVHLGAAFDLEESDELNGHVTGTVNLVVLVVTVDDDFPLKALQNVGTHPRGITVELTVEHRELRIFFLVRVFENGE